MSGHDYFDRHRPRASAGPSPGAVLLLIFLLLLLGGGLLVWIFWPGRGRVDAQPRAITPRGELSDLEKSFIAIFKQASPSVVHITTSRRLVSRFRIEDVPEGTGSGFIWDEHGHIVTNFHVIQNAASAKVIFNDRSSADAEFVGGYPEKDLAVLRVRVAPAKLRPLAIGTSADLQVGQLTFAIGNPFGLDQTLTQGIVSALDREMDSVAGTPIRGMIQTDAAVNPGNSGGPLLDSAGRLIGVNTAIISPSRASAGIGFAIPVDDVNRIVPQLIRAGKVTRPGLGIQVGDDSRLRALGLKGALVWQVIPGSPAEKAGLLPTRIDRAGRFRLGDVIIAVDDKPVATRNDLFAVLEQYEVGQTVRLTVFREGEEVQLDVTLATLE